MTIRTQCVERIHGQSNVLGTWDKCSHGLSCNLLWMVVRTNRRDRHTETDKQTETHTLRLTILVHKNNFGISLSLFLSFTFVYKLRAYTDQKQFGNVKIILDRRAKRQGDERHTHNCDRHKNWTSRLRRAQHNSCNTYAKTPTDLVPKGRNLYIHI